MVRTENTNIEHFAPLTPPDVLKSELPLSPKAEEAVITARTVIENILSRRDSRLMIIAGPCSIHSEEETLAYARKFKALAEELSDRLFLIMRVYFEKPRTTLGWKGLIYDPYLDNSYNVEAGLRLARRILLDVAELGLPAATEILEPVVPQYITDLISWGTIGARTTESQTHRQLASGLSMPIGFKNATDGSLKAALDAIKTAISPHSFIGVTGEGKVGVFQTRGNAYGHLILRGGGSGPNFASEHIAYASELLRKNKLASNIVVDCSHGNSGKDPANQLVAARDVGRQLQGGELNIRGIMLESNLESGRQDIPADIAKLRPGMSITDACIGWNDTETIIRELYALVRHA